MHNNFEFDNKQLTKQSTKEKQFCRNSPLFFLLILQSDLHQATLMSNKQSSSAEKSVDSDTSSNYLSPLDTANDHVNEKVATSANGVEHPEKVLVKMKVKRKSGISKSLVKVKRSRIKSASKATNKSLEIRSSSQEMASRMVTPKSSSSEELMKHPVKVRKLVKSSLKMKVKKKKRKVNAEGSASSATTPHSSSDDLGKFVNLEATSHLEHQQSLSSDSSNSPATSALVNSTGSLKKSPFVDVLDSSVPGKQQQQPKTEEASLETKQKESSKSSSKKIMPDISAFVTTAPLIKSTGDNESEPFLGKSNKSAKADTVSGSLVTAQAAAKSIKSEKPTKSSSDESAKIAPSQVHSQTSGGRQEVLVAPDNSPLSSMYIIVGAVILACLYAYWKMS